VIDMKINFKPRFIPSKWLVPRRFSGITILWWVFYRRPRNADEMLRGLTVFPDGKFGRHETIHSWQQTVLFALGVVACVLTSIICGLFGAVTPWWVWFFPVTVPFVLYALVWLVELVLPPYNRAYRDSIFEREAYMNDGNPDYVPGVFSVWRYFRKGRPLRDGK
jgi:hypothetical protein